MKHTRHIILTALLLVPLAALRAADAPRHNSRAWVKAPVVANKVKGACEPVRYAGLRLDPASYLGRRVEINVRTGLLQTFDVDAYLASYGTNPKWPTGEYLGKIMQGLSRMHLYSGNAIARQRLDRIVAKWREIQTDNGWLGTTARFKIWDVWEHKYVLLGLVDYYALTGDDKALNAARKIGDLYCATIGPDLGDINQSGHWALGSASILEPMTYLYRYTGDPKYLRFCEYIVTSFEGPTGPKLISILTTGAKRVCDIEDTFANRAAREMQFGTTIGQVRNRSKGYEMLSCSIGLARMYQLTGEPEYLAVAVNAWDDIARNRLYLAGSSGADECFKDDHCLPAEAGDGPAEGCVTAHWIFLSRVLFEITGEPRYVETLENALYNYLLASQRPQDCFQSYNPGMNGAKTFQKHDVKGAAGKAPCCLTSVMREIARTPEAIWTKFAAGGLGVLLYTASTLEDTIQTKSGPLSVRVEMDTDFPKSGNVTLRVRPEKPADFRLALRVPDWAKDYIAQVAGQKHTGTPGQFLNLEREWKDGDVVQVEMNLNERLVPGGVSYPGHFAFLRGPQVLTLVAGKGAEKKLAAACVQANQSPRLTQVDDFLPAGWIGGQAYTSPALVGADGCALIPFGDSSQAGVSRECRTWIPLQPGTGMAAPTAPSELKGTALSETRIKLAWKGEGRNADGWRIERRRADVGMWFHVKTIPSGVTSCVDDFVNVVTPGKTYSYRVAAFNAGGLSKYSEEVAVRTPPVTVPKVSSELKAVAVSPTQVNLAWKDNSDTEDGFQLECKVGAAGGWKAVQGRTPPNVPSLTDYGLEPGQTYAYRVRTFNAAGESVWSNEVTVKTSQRKWCTMKLKFLPTQSILVIAACLVTLPAATHAAVNAQPIPDATHVTVRHEKGRCFGWPANGGVWNWGNEILVQYKHGEFQDKPVGSHDINYGKPIVLDQSRSLDGGLTWTHHATTLVSAEDDKSRIPATTLTTPIDFSPPDTILKFDWAGSLYYSIDRGVKWRGPFNLPRLGTHTWQLRTDYLVEDKNTALAFWSGSKEKFKRDENGGMVYMVKTTDGGLTWTKEALVSRVTEPSETRHDVALMPATVRVSPSKLVCCIRNLTAYPKKGWIECRVSTDNGQTWELASTPVGDEAGTTPPALLKLPDGRLVLSYGYRKPIAGPTSIRAKISADDGVTWGEELILRTGGGDEDIGYTRNALRPDGKIVTIYYWQENEKVERDIAATIWTPPAAGNAGASDSQVKRRYYVDAHRGQDTNAGSLVAPWRTIQKAAGIMKAGDTAFIRAGIYRETVTPQSGQTFSAYENEKPLVTGCDPVSGWAVHSGNIYKAAVNAKVHDVFSGTNYMHKARWPNFQGDYLDVSSWAKGFSRKTQGQYRVTFDALTPPADVVGGWYCGIHGALNFCPNEGRITAVNGRQLTVTDIRENDWHWTDPKHSGAGVGCIVNHLNCLDAEKEWHWQDGTLYFWALGGGTPTHVLARTRIYGFVLQNVSNVSLKGLYLHGASVHLNGGSDNTVDGCHFRYASPWGNAKGPARFATSWGSTEDGAAGLCVAGSHHTVKNCSLVGGWGSGIRLEGNDLTVRNNYLEDFGWFGRWLAAPISGFGTRLRIENNTIKRSGGCGITLVQKNPGDGANVNHVRYPTIRHNDIRDVAYLLMDGGSFIYINNDDVPSADRRLDGEIAFNVGAGLRSRSTEKFFWGIYIDNGADFVTLHHNVILSLNPKTAGAGIFLHGAQHKQENIFCYHNTIGGNFNSAIAAHTWGKGSISNVVFRNNHALQTGFRATAIGGVTASHNRGNVPASEFMDPANGNFRLKPGSASINAGVVIPGINEAGSASPLAGSVPDLGAYEFGGADWRAGATVTPSAFPAN